MRPPLSSALSFSFFLGREWHQSTELPRCTLVAAPCYPSASLCPSHTLYTIHTCAQENRNAYYMKNYPDFFATVGKTMVKRPDGSFELVSDEELVELKKANKVGVEYATAMGGRVRDVTQKPFLVFKE
uniref:Uncharacterized protein n=1 Tax=Craspedostauros australis TaxID=1486917 RepID=A0A7R9WUL8_9STRA|mmetsp:Transcript_21399/g.59535  ORF Transcript_21399/g.59535 Transcript_21399/m.59535 type:complete len:128 (+) Transcript_21399:11-394(+)